ILPGNHSVYYAASSAQIIGNVIPQNILIVILQGVKVRIRRSLAGQPLAVTYKLDIAQAGGYTPVAVCIEGVEIDGHVAVTAGIDHHRIQDRIDLAVHHLGRILAGSIEEIT